jgi:hypothetical protein
MGNGEVRYGEVHLLLTLEDHGMAITVVLCVPSEIILYLITVNVSHNVIL